MKNYCLYLCLMLPISFAFQKFSDKPLPIMEASAATGLPDFIIAELEPGIYQADRFVVPFTYKIKNIGNKVANLDGLTLKVIWSASSSSSSNSIYIQSFKLENGVPYNNTLSPNATLEQTFEMKIPNNNLTKAKTVPWMKALINPTLSTSFGFGSTHKVEESNYLNNVRAAFVNYNIRDHRGG